VRRTWIALALTLTAGMAIGTVASQALNAQQSPLKVTELIKTDAVGMEGKEIIVQLVEFSPGAVTGKHYHPGHEVAYILEGSGTLEVEGKSPVPLASGEAQYVPATKVHEGKNASKTDRLRLVVFRLHEKGQPVTVPVK
jgi:quercetin dioxygenase-like cupin family protein